MTSETQSCTLVTMPRKRPVYRDGKVHVLKAMCATCIFRPGNLMNLKDDHVDQMVADCIKHDGCIPCHTTLDGPQAVCYGFFKLHATSPLQIAERMGFIEFQEEVKI